MFMFPHQISICFVNSNSPTPRTLILLHIHRTARGYMQHSAYISRHTACVRRSANRHAAHQFFFLKNRKVLLSLPEELPVHANNQSDLESLLLPGNRCVGFTMLCRMCLSVQSKPSPETLCTMDIPGAWSSKPRFPLTLIMNSES